MARNRASYVLGIEAEWLAAVFLRMKGYRILGRRYAAAGGEIDLIARRGGTLVFVEVKARDDLEVARTAISPVKRQRLERAARAYLARLSRLPETIRFDAVFLAPNAWPRHETAIMQMTL